MTKTISSQLQCLFLFMPLIASACDQGGFVNAESESPTEEDLQALSVLNPTSMVMADQLIYGTSTGVYGYPPLVDATQVAIADAGSMFPNGVYALAGGIINYWDSTSSRWLTIDGRSDAVACGPSVGPEHLWRIYNGRYQNSPAGSGGGSWYDRGAAPTGVVKLAIAKGGIPVTKLNGGNGTYNGRLMAKIIRSIDRIADIGANYNSPWAYFVTMNGIFYSNRFGTNPDGTFKPFSQPPDFPKLVAVDSNGNPWVWTNSNCRYRYTGTTWIPQGCL